MPTILRAGPYRVFFFSADCGEPAHVHVQRERHIAKVWLHGPTLARLGGFTAGEVARILGIVRDNSLMLRERWDEHCGR